MKKTIAIKNEQQGTNRDIDAIIDEELFLLDRSYKAKVPQPGSVKTCHDDEHQQLNIFEEEMKQSEDSKESRKIAESILMEMFKDCSNLFSSMKDSSEA